MRKKKLMARKLVAITLSACMLSVLVACGSDDDDDDSGATPPQQQQTDGVFRGTFQPGNPSLNNTINGNVTVTRQGDDFRVEIDVNGAPGGVHMQHMHIGSSCPTPAADTNNDGIIDVVEAEAVSGAPVVPFDSDLSSNTENTYPSGRSYRYSESTSVALMTGDVQNEEETTPTTSETAEETTTTEAPESEGTVLTTLVEQGLEGRVVEIHGVPANTDLPDTVATKDGMPVYQTVPIACAVLERVTEEEETPATEETPPTAEETAPATETPATNEN